MGTSAGPAESGVWSLESGVWSLAPVAWCHRVVHDTRGGNQLGEMNVEFRLTSGDRQFKDSLKEGRKVTLGCRLFPNRVARFRKS